MSLCMLGPADMYDEYFHWDIDRVIVDLGLFELRYYGLFFALGLLFGVTALARSFRDRGYPEQHASKLSLYMPIGMILGAHLIHLIFYEPESFIKNPIRIIEIGEGLASHGGGLGAFLALYFFCRHHRVELHKYLDACMVGAVWVFPWVRIANFFNSEVVGRYTEVPWGVVFVQLKETQPRHPSQLYEALLGFGLIGLTEWLHRTKRERLRPGALIYLVLGIYFAARFGLEYFKEYQSHIISPAFPFTMGQLLSGPVALFCFYMVFFSEKHSILKPAEAGTYEPPPGPEPAPAPGTAASGRIVKKKKGKKRRK